MAEMTENKVKEIIGIYIDEHSIGLPDFTSVSSVGKLSSVLLVQESGAGNKIGFSEFKSQVISEIKEPADVVIKEVEKAGKDAALVVEAATKAVGDANTAAISADEAAKRANTAATKAVGDANTAAISADEAAKRANTAAANVKDGKTPVFGNVTAKGGDKASATYKLNGVDANGNPKYDVDFTLEKGADGIVLKGERATAAEIKAITGGKRGDTYKALDTGRYWSYDGSTWNDIGEIIPGAINEVISKIRGIDNTSNKDSFFICDSKGYVIAEINENGIKSKNFIIVNDSNTLNIYDILSKSQQLPDIIGYIDTLQRSLLPQNNKEYIICDGVGNTIFRIDKEGVHFKQSKTYLDGKVMMSLCDSLGTAGVWQNTIAELTGMSFDKELNYNGDPDVAFSVGGSQTASHPNGGFDRAKRLVEYVKGGGKVDVVFIENINDMAWVDTAKSKEEIDDEILTLQPHQEINYKYIDTDKTNFTDALKEFKDNLSNYIGNIEPTPCMAIYVGYTIVGKMLTITGKATSDGTINIIVGGKSYGITVYSTDSIEDIIDKIVEIDYTEPTYTDTKKSTGSVEFVAADEEPNISFEPNDTGITFSITANNTQKYYGLTYNSYSKSQSDWLDSNNWIDKWSIKLSQQIKGLLEYLCTNLPDVQFYWFIPTRFAGTIPSVKKADGSINFDAYKKENIRYELCVYTQKKVCEYYSIPYIDLHDDGGVNILNQLSYYVENGGVHPPYTTYEYWGKRAIRFIV